MREAEELVLPHGMSSARSGPGRRFFRPCFPSRAGPPSARGKCRHSWGHYFRKLPLLLIAREPSRQTDLHQQPSRPPGPRLPVFDLDREQVPHDAVVAQGVDEVGNQEAISPAVRLGEVRFFEYRSEIRSFGRKTGCGGMGVTPIQTLKASSKDIVRRRLVNFCVSRISAPGDRCRPAQDRYGPPTEGRTCSRRTGRPSCS